MRCASVSEMCKNTVTFSKERKRSYLAVSILTHALQTRIAKGFLGFWRPPRSESPQMLPSFFHSLPCLSKQNSALWQFFFVLLLVKLETHCSEYCFFLVLDFFTFVFVKMRLRKFQFQNNSREWYAKPHRGGATLPVRPRARPAALRHPACWETSYDFQFLRCLISRPVKSRGTVPLLQKVKGPCTVKFVRITPMRLRGLRWTRAR